MNPRRPSEAESRRHPPADAAWGRDARIQPDAGRALFAVPESVWPNVLLGLMMLTVVYLPNIAQFNIDTGLRGVNPANILFILTLGVLLLSNHPPSEPTPLKAPLLLFMGVLVYALVVALAGDSTAWVEDVTVWKNGVFYLLLYFLFFHAVRDMATVRILLLTLLFVIFTSSVLGVRQALDYGIGSFHESKRVSAPFGWSAFDANRSAVFFCIYVMPAVSVALFLKSRPWLRLACAVLTLLCVFTVFHTYSRQSYFILAVLILAFALRKHLLLALLAGTMLLYYDLWVPQAVVDRIEMTTRDPFELSAPRPAPVRTFDAPPVGFSPGYGTSYGPSLTDPFGLAPQTAGSGAEDDTQYDESTESRFTLWEGAWELISSRPGGIGWNRFKREITPHVPPILAGKDAHNFYVLLATEAGLVAPVFLLALLGALVLLGHRLSRVPDDEEARTLGLGFVMATLAVVLGNIYGSRFLDGDVMGLYWVLTALVARTLILKERDRRDRQVTAARQAAAAAAARKAAQASGRTGHGSSPARTR